MIFCFALCAAALNVVECDPIDVDIDTTHYCRCTYGVGGCFVLQTLAYYEIAVGNDSESDSSRLQYRTFIKNIIPSGSSIIYPVYHGDSIVPVGGS